MRGVAEQSATERRPSATSLSPGPQTEPEERPPAVSTEEPKPSSSRAVLAVLLLLAAVGAIVASQRWKSARAWPEGLIQVTGRIEGDEMTLARLNSALRLPQTQRFLFRIPHSPFRMWRATPRSRRSS
jgi:hypothetical protein